MTLKPLVIAIRAALYWRARFGQMTANAKG